MTVSSILVSTEPYRYILSMGDVPVGRCTRRQNVTPGPSYTESA